MKNKWMKIAIKIVSFIILIPVLGFGVPFGGAYVYGRIQHRIHMDRAESILNQYESVLMQSVDSPIFSHSSTISGIASISREDGALLFSLPYDYTKLFNWVPCGLMYCQDTTRIEHWRRIEPLKDDWYFYRDTN